MTDSSDTTIFVGRAGEFADFHSPGVLEFDKLIEVIRWR
jgi:hypothetical protein